MISDPVDVTQADDLYKSQMKLRCTAIHEQYHETTTEEIRSYCATLNFKNCPRFIERNKGKRKKFKVRQ